MEEKNKTAALLAACREGSAERVQELLESGVVVPSRAPRFDSTVSEEVRGHINLLLNQYRAEKDVRNLALMNDLLFNEADVIAWIKSLPENERRIGVGEYEDILNHGSEAVIRVLDEAGLLDDKNKSGPSWDLLREILRAKLPKQEPDQEDSVENDHQSPEATSRETSEDEFESEFESFIQGDVETYPSILDELASKYSNKDP